MSAPAPFLGSATERLLPASIPFRFFAMAGVFQVLAWLALFFGAADLPGYSGGAGWVLAAIHLLTLGVLAASAIGASFQLLPVATRSPIRVLAGARLCFWLLVPGIPVLTLGMGTGDYALIQPGAALVIAALLLFCALSIGNLARARGLPVVAAHGWAGLAALLGVMLVAALLIGDARTGFLADHQGLARFHMLLAVFGFMGFLVLGFSLILVPMFTLSGALSQRLGWGQVLLGGLAALALVGAALTGSRALLVLAALLACGSAGAYLWHMRRVLRAAMRKRLGLSFLMIRASWWMLGAGLLVGLALALDLPIPNGAALFGVLVLPGWLLTFLGGILQRIAPFLASMHVAAASGAPALLSDLTPELPLQIHALGHFVALALILAGVILNIVWLVQLGALAGGLGALSFAVFLGLVLLHLRHPSGAI